jgi:hypothetical protein
MDDPDLVALDAVVGGVGIAGDAKGSSVEFRAVAPKLGKIGQQVDG